MNKIFHPNFIEGPIWLKKLADSSSFPTFKKEECWETSTKLAEIIKIIIELLKNPDTLQNIGAIHNPDAQNLFDKNRIEYNKRVKEYIQKFAEKPE
jgi:ubiquitin-protein ligase